MLAIRGHSEIARMLCKQLQEPEQFTYVPRDQDMPLEAERYLFCAGLLRAKRSNEQSQAEITEGMRVNLWYVTDQCERILSANAKARICVLGSESGYSGSYDDTYARAKKLLHKYVEGKHLKSEQQLVAVAPSIIADCGMTLRREDYDTLERRRFLNPKRRFLNVHEVAAMVYHLLYVDLGYTTNVVVRMNGGSHTNATASPWQA